MLLRMTAWTHRTFIVLVSWLDHSIGTGHRPNASQITPALALSFIHSFIHSHANVLLQRELLANQLTGHSTQNRLDRPGI